VTNPTVPQYTTVEGMTPDQIDTAHQAGQLNTLLGAPAPAAPPAAGQIHNLTGYTPDQIDTAHRNGQLGELLAGFHHPQGA
jgi:hypothetical protein